MLSEEEIRSSYRLRGDKLIGRKLSEETKRKISEAKKGKCLSLETRAKMSAAQKGKHPHTEEFRKNQSERMIKNNPVKLNPSLGFQKGSGNPMFGKVPSHLVGDKNPMKNPETVKFVMEKRIEKLVKGLSRKPNYVELKLKGFLQFWFPNEYKYVGNFKVWIGGKNPDFININGKKKIVELFGEAWHSVDDEQIRKDHFKKFGFDTLVVWAKELGNPLKLGNKLRAFHVPESHYLLKP